MKVLVSGGTGFVGSRLIELLRNKGHEVVIVSRSIPTGISSPSQSIITWDDLSNKGLPSGTNAIVQLAGHKVFNQSPPWWTASHKQFVFDSRIKTADCLISAVKKYKEPGLSVYVTSSAVGLYQINNTTPHTEDNYKEGIGFLTEVCKQVEAKADELAKATAAAASSESSSTAFRSVKMRIGIVLGTKGGALQNMLPPFRFGLGGTLGFGGTQSFPWIHIDDMARLILFAIENSTINGPVNGVAPTHVNNYEFTKALGKVLNRPTISPVPGFLLKTLMGDQSTLLLDGQNVYPKKAIEAGFQFEHPEIEEALQDILSRNA